MSSLSPLKIASLVLLPSLLSILGILNTRHIEAVSPPVAATSSYTIHGCALPLNPPLANSHSPEGYPIEVVDIQGPSHGTISRPNAYNASYCPNYKRRQPWRRTFDGSVAVYREREPHY